MCVFDDDDKCFLLLSLHRKSRFFFFTFESLTSIFKLLLFLVSTSAVEVRKWSFEKREWVRKNERETQEEEEERELDEYDGVFGVWFLVYGF